MSRIFNFNAGPATLPTAVMNEAAAGFADYNGLGYGILEASHRSPEFQEVIDTAEQNIRTILSVPDDYAVLFLQGGASMQFAMIPMNFLPAAGAADFVDTGVWSKKAIKEAKLFGAVSIAASSGESNYDRIPAVSEWTRNDDAAYLHITSNNTIYGTQFQHTPDVAGGVPLMADMSSDIMSRAIDVSTYGLIYAGAQKNLGPSGVTLVIIRKDLAERSPESVPSMLKYATHISSNSLFNTPPTFAIYMLMLTSRWVLNEGGLPAIEARNRKKARRLYDIIDADDYYSGHASPGSRSIMNVCFRLPTPELEQSFITTANARGMIGLKGHRSIGGCRASIYNAMPEAGVECLADFMVDFRRKNG